ncbi:MAG TPA: UDP-glucose/GDP-mannose dehydrogenase family protein [Chloroflexota bacterium]|nr:UDP-glucose/GDP-mannose dehydrogenase family protein [Chloroflexota bacterium]
MSAISVVGTGYVGLVTGACFADLGNRVTCIDVDEAKIALLREGGIPIYEPGLEELVERNVRTGRLSFTTRYEEGIDETEFVFVAVNTPPGPAGEADMTYARAAAHSIAEHLRSSAIVVNKSTMPIGTGDWVAGVLARQGSVQAPVVSNPEFLREGSAIADFQRPDRVVLGADDRPAAERVAQLYAPLKAPILITDLRTAEMIKYASNAFLATKISFINEIASICERMGADVKEVARGMGLDPRIGPAFLDAGVGYGGSCFPKDVQALAHMAALSGCHPQLLRAVMDINRDARLSVILKLRSALGGLEERTIGILGLAFKPNTDDMREAASVEIIHLLQQEGAHIRAYDPAAMPKAEALLTRVRFCEDAYETARGSDALVLVTEWNEFKRLDLRRIHSLMASPTFVDGRNVYEPSEMAALGFEYYGIGRAAGGGDLINGERSAQEINTPA